MKKIQTKKDRLDSLKKRGNLIKESFQAQFNKIKRVNETELSDEELSDEELEALAAEDSEYEDKAHKAFNSVNELDIDTYAKQMNTTSEFPTRQFGEKDYDNPRTKGNKQQRVNDLSKEGFERQFYSKYPKGQVTFKSNNGLWVFDAISFQANHTMYLLNLKGKSTNGGDDYIRISKDNNDELGYYIYSNDSRGLVFDEDSNNTLREMLKHSS